MVDPSKLKNEPEELRTTAVQSHETEFSSGKHSQPISCSPSDLGERSFSRTIAPIMCGIVLVLVGFSTWSAINFHSYRHAFLYLNGVLLVAEPSIVSIGERRTGNVCEATFLLRNLSGRRIRIIGSNSSCSCTSTDVLPVDIPPGGSRQLKLKIHLNDKPIGPLSQDFAYLTESPQQPIIPVKIIGNIVR